jgi:hypothetical protein
VAKEMSVWQAGTAAWKRLTVWQQRSAPLSSSDQDGDAAADALADIGMVRHLLDQVELLAVRTARRQGKSWTEIATNLGVTRQSAWERWRDLDATDDASADITDDKAEPAQEVTFAAAEELVARGRRRRSTVSVPRVIGMRWDDARQRLQDSGLVGVRYDPDGPSLAALGWPNVVVTDQSPESGAKVPADSPVTLWLERGSGSAGVREPRRPKPTPRSGLEMRAELSDEAVG